MKMDGKTLLESNKSNNKSKRRCKYESDLRKINAAIVRGTENEAIAYLKEHPELLIKLDGYGLSSLKFACIYHVNRVISFLISRGANVNFQEEESGNSPLHYASIYGHCDTYILLLNHGADINLLNKSNVTPLTYFEMQHPNRARFKKLTSLELNCDVYALGKNSNYNLGLMSEKSIEVPELVEFPALKEDDIVVKICTHKFHTLFLTNQGSVYSCGHSCGGRLGINANSSIIVPQKIERFSKVKILMTDVGVDHSIFLSDRGMIFTCGVNSYRQLGLLDVDSVVEPYPLTTWFKQHSQLIGNMIGVGAGAYHSAFWSRTELYTFGLNVGQLGHPVDASCDVYVSEPRRVSAVTSLMMRKGDKIEQVFVGDSAIVVSTSTGDVYILHKHLVHPILTSRKMSIGCFPCKLDNSFSDIKAIACVGGTLQSKSKVACDKLSHHQPSDLFVCMLSKSYELHVWFSRSGTNRFSHWHLDDVYDFCINQNEILYVTTTFEAFTCQINKLPFDLISSMLDLQEMRSVNQIQLIQPRSFALNASRLSNMPRPFALFTDPNGNNTFVLQYNPHEMIQRSIQQKCSSFNKDLLQYIEKYTDELYCDVVMQADDGGKPLYGHSYILAHFSKFFRDVILANCTVNRLQTENKITIQIHDVNTSSLEEVINHLNLRAATFTSSNLPSDEAHNIHKSMKQSKSHGIDIHNWNDLCKRFQLIDKPKRFSRHLYPKLYDVWFKCDDSDELVGAHSCILMARSSHFEVSLSFRWNSPTDDSTTKQVPISKKIFEVVLDYLYCDDYSAVKCFNVDTLIELLEFTNQFFLTNLMQVCEECLISKLSLKNCFLLLHVAITFRAKILVKYLHEFIVYNMLTLINSRSMRNVPMDALKDITTAYRSLFFISENLPIFSNLYLEKETSGSEEDDNNDIDKEPWYTMKNSKRFAPIIVQRGYISSFMVQPGTCDTKLDKLMKNLCVNESPTEQEVRDALEKNPSVAFETENDWFQEGIVKVVASKKSRMRYTRTRNKTSSSQMSVDPEKDIPLDVTPLPFDEHIRDLEKLRRKDKKWHTVGRRKATSLSEEPCNDQPLIQNVIHSIFCSQGLEDNSQQLKSEDLNPQPVLSLGEAFAQRKKSNSENNEEFRSSNSEFPEKSHSWGESSDAVVNLMDIMATEAMATPHKSPQSLPISIFPHENNKDNLSPQGETPPRGWTVPEEDKLIECQPPVDIGAIKARQTNFNAIMEDQMSKLKNLIKTRNKSMHFIQLEERAMTELLEHYGGAHNPDELVTVARAAAPLESPTWKN